MCPVFALMPSHVPTYTYKIERTNFVHFIFLCVSRFLLAQSFPVYVFLRFIHTLMSCVIRKNNWIYCRPNVFESEIFASNIRQWQDSQVNCSKLDIEKYFTHSITPILLGSTPLSLSIITSNKLYSEYNGIFNNCCCLFVCCFFLAGGFCFVHIYKCLIIDYASESCLIAITFRISDDTRRLYTHIFWPF